MDKTMLAVQVPAAFEKAVTELANKTGVKRSEVLRAILWIGYTQIVSPDRNRDMSLDHIRELVELRGVMYDV
jgi:hypothetical protein